MAKDLEKMSLKELWHLFPIQLEEHNPDWKNWFYEEKLLIIDSIGKENIERIHHIGSTSVEGLIAKPIIDIILEIKRGTDLDHLKESFQNIGYRFSAQPKNPAPHLMFMKGYTNKGFANRVFHVHIRYLDDWEQMYFRDYLSEHGVVAKEYGELKLKLKDSYEFDRDGYTEAKTNFIKKYTILAKQKYLDRYKPEGENK